MIDKALAPASPPRAARRARLAIALAAALAPWVAMAAEPVQPALSPELAREYARPHEGVDIGGRRLNLFCIGSGAQTVLLEAGGSDWSDIWALVHPAVARSARACVYDRAGLGHSDPAAGPRTPIAIVEDLHALIAAAKLRTPLVLVGHSLGGFNVKLYAALYPQDVAGLVLIDPAEERSPERSRTLLRRQFGASLAARSELLDETFLTRLMDRYARCVEAARERPLEAGSQTYRRCSDPVRPQLGPQIAEERTRIQVTTAYQAAQASEFANSVYGDPKGDPAYASLFRPGLLGRRPVIVLTHGRFDADDPLDAAGQAAGVALHRETARLSKTGRQRTVADATHNIQLDAPDAVVSAIAEVLNELGRDAPARAR